MSDTGSGGGSGSGSGGGSGSGSGAGDSQPNDFQMEQDRLARKMLELGVSDTSELTGEVLDNFDPSVIEAGPQALL